MAEASLVPSTPSSHPQAQQSQPIDFNAPVVPGDACSMAGSPEAGPPLFPFALMGRTRAQTTQLREGEGGAGTAVAPLSTSIKQRGPADSTTPTPTTKRSSRTAGAKKTSSTPTTVTVATSKTSTSFSK